MNSSISNSERGAASGMAHTLLCLGVFASLTAGGLATTGRFRPLVAQISGQAPANSYLAYFNGAVEDYAIYHNLDGDADALKSADVLFLGNSRTKYAFRNLEVTDPFFAARHLRYFNLAFGYGEGEVFPEAIIHKFDLHPKWVIVNADPFFGKSPSVVASRAMAFGSLEAWKIRFETESSFAVQRRLHKVFPYLALSQWDGFPKWIYYRTRDSGTLQLAAWRGEGKAVIADQDAAGLKVTQGALKAAAAFKKELDERGAKLVLTWVPPSSGNTARAIAEKLNVPVIVPIETGLATFDGSHLDEESCRRFSNSFLAAFGRLLDQ